MKIGKILALLLAVALLCGCLAACGSAPKAEEPAEEPQAAEPAAEPEAPAEEPAAEPADAGETYTLVFSFCDPETNNQYTDVFKPYFDKITEATDGRVQFECHFNGELAGLMESYDAVAKGTVDIAYIRSGSLSYCPFESLLENPPITGALCTRNAYVLDQLYSEYPELEECYTGVKFMLRYQMYYGYLGTSSQPIETYDDLKGKTLIIGNAMAAQRLAAFGATPLDVLPPDFYTSLEKGLADGAFTVTMPEMISYSWADVIKNVTTVPVIHGMAALIINPDTWNSLPADIQQIIEELEPEAIELADTAMNAASEQAIETLKAEYDTVFIEPSEDLISAMQAGDDEAIPAKLAELEAAWPTPPRFTSAIWSFTTSTPSDLTSRS